MKQITDIEKAKLLKVLCDLGDLKIASDLLPQIANEIVSFYSLARVKKLPRSKLCTIEQAIKELQDLSKKAWSLRSHILKMHKSSLDTFTASTVIHPVAILADLEAITLHANRVNIEALTTVNSTVGRPPAVDLEAFVGFLAKIYTRLTGRKATKSMKENEITGPYVRFVKNVFNSLNIKGSAASQVLEQLKKRYKKS